MGTPEPASHLPELARPVLAASADPARAERGVARIVEIVPGAMERLEADAWLLGTVVGVVAASPFLTRTCMTDPLALEVLSAPGTRVAPLEPLARWKALEVLRVAALDLAGSLQLEAVGASLAMLADELVGAAAAGAGTGDELAVIGMGKLGAQELNYGSDIDLVLVGSGDPQPLLARLRPAWRVDLDLRPEGRAGPLVRSLESYEAYWDRWAETWEFQALLKARHVGGGALLGGRFVASAAQRLWSRPLGADDLRNLRLMKARAEQLVARRGLTEREIKLGRGGIRDIEFAAQLLQLVHGRQDSALRVPATLDALAALSAGGYIDADDARALDAAYRFLRTIEHRLQLFEDRQVHALPASPEARGHLARVMGYRDGPGGTALAKLEDDLARHQSAARSVHERLFFRPLLEAFTTKAAGDTAPGAAVGLAERAVGERLAAFGFSDARRTRDAVLELTQGLSRTSRLMHAMVPLLLDWLSESPDPDLGLLGLRRMATGRHRRSQLSALFRESPEAARQICTLLGTGPGFVTGYERHPEQLALLESGLPPPPGRSALEKRAADSLTWRAKDQQWRGLGSVVQGEMLRAQARDVLGLADVVQTARCLTDLAEAVLAVSLEAVGAGAGGLSNAQSGTMETGELAKGARGMAIIAMGRFGGAELAYASDLDVMVVFDDDVVPAEVAEPMAERWLRLVKGATPVQRLYELDLSLRPEGRKGTLARSVRAYETYYDRWAQVWERQALLRGRVVAGDPAVGKRFAALATDFVWGHPLSGDDITEIRRLKARMEKERVPPGDDPEFHLKLGPGSLSDVEWTVQLLQLQTGVKAEGTLDALAQLRSHGAIDPADAATLAEAYQFCESTRNRLYIVRGHPGGSLPGPGHQLTVLARSLGTTAPALREQYRRLTRRARKVVERLFYGGG